MAANSRLQRGGGRGRSPFKPGANTKEQRRQIAKDSMVNPCASTGTWVGGPSYALDRQRCLALRLRPFAPPFWPRLANYCRDPATGPWAGSLVYQSTFAEGAKSPTVAFSDDCSAQLLRPFRPGAWCSVLGARCLVLGARCLVLGARCSVLGARCSVLGVGG
jgi:hypothetical protein